jgi:multiple sugar transport system permease protein
VLANLLSRKIRGAPLFITVFFLPSIVTGVATFVLWGVLLNPESGVVNAVLGLAGLDVPVRVLASWLHLQDPLLWLKSETWAKPALILVGLWGSIGGYNMVLYLAALQSIPPALYEAADIDGANAFQKFWHVTWPMVSPTTFFIFTMALIRGFQGGFAAAYVMTEGGPAGATTTISYYIYNLAFSRRFEMGYACAVAWVLFIITFILALINWRYTRRRVYGEFGV